MKSRIFQLVPVLGEKVRRRVEQEGERKKKRERERAKKRRERESERRDTESDVFRYFTKLVSEGGT